MYFRKRHLLFFLLSLIWSGCSEEIEITLTTDPTKSVATGESIVVIAQGNFNERGLTWFADGIPIYSCNKKSTCVFSRQFPKSAKVTVKAAAEVDEDRGTIHDIFTAITGAGGDSAADGQASITLTWFEATEDTETTTSSG